MVKHLCHLSALNFVCDSVIKFTRQWMCNKIFYWNIEYFLMVLPILVSHSYYCQYSVELITLMINDHHTTHFFSVGGFIFDPTGHWKSLANSLMLEKGP